jgi:hypothetical protein
MPLSFWLQELPEVSLLYLCLIRKIRSLLVAFATFWWIFSILRCLDVRADVRHWEALIFFAGARRTFSEILFALVQRKLLSTINAHIFTSAYFLSCCIRLLFGQLIHQNFHAHQRYI